MAIDLAPPDGCVERLSILGGAGPLSGTRLAVKDNIEVAGAIFSAGHPAFAGRRGTATATAVQALLDAGAKLVAMAATDAGGFGVTTPGVHNPCHPGRVVGGSSGGCAALLAAGQAELGLGTDTGGSIRIPAACTGLWGLKLPHGTVSGNGLWPMAPGLDSFGLMAADPALLQPALAALLPANTPAREPKVRIGVCLGAGWRRDTVITRLFAEAVERLARQGVEMVEMPLPDREAIGRCHATRVLDETLAVHEGLARDRLAIATQRALGAAERLTPTDKANAVEYQKDLTAFLDDQAQQVDAILSPTLPVMPPKAGQRRVRLGGMSVLSALTAETCLANLSGRPAISGPAGLLPLQLTGLGMTVQDLVSTAPSLFDEVKFIPSTAPVSRDESLT